MAEGTIQSIYRYPVKGLSPQALPQVTLTVGGTLPADRAYAIENGPTGFDPAHPAYFPKQRFLMLMRNERLAALKTGYDEQNHTLTIEHDYITNIEGAGVDAELMRSYIAAWSSQDGDRDAYAVSHVGYGLNPAARWDSMALYDKRDFNGTELRAFAGNFLYSTGANEVAGRYTQGHFDLPLRHCTIALDGAIVVDQGQVVA